MMKMPNRIPHRWMVLLAVGVLGASCSGAVAELALKTAEGEPPRELAEPVRQVLQARAVQLVEGDQPIYEFWFRAALPLRQAPESAGKALAATPETTVLGAVRVHKDRRDYREDEIHSGVYTMRLGLRPDDGNHLGTSEYNYFAVLVPAKLDTTLEGIATYKDLVTASRKETSSDHPMCVSLRPADSDQGEFPRLNVPAADHKSILVKIPAQVAGADGPAAAVFDLVYEGVAKH